MVSRLLRNVYARTAIILLAFVVYDVGFDGGELRHFVPVLLLVGTALAVMFYAQTIGRLHGAKRQDEE